MTADDPEQDALFELEGPDEDSCVWLVSGSGEGAIVLNLGPRDAVADKLAAWLAGIDFGETERPPECDDHQAVEEQKGC